MLLLTPQRPEKSTCIDLHLGALAKQESIPAPAGPIEALTPRFQSPQSPPTLARSFPRCGRQPQPAFVLPPCPWGFRISCSQMHLCLPDTGGDWTRCDFVMSLQGPSSSLRNFRSLDMVPTLRSPLLLLLPYLLAGHLPRTAF